MIEITVDVTKWTRHLADVEQRQIPFAMSRALNATGLQVQRAERDQLHRVFTLRRPEWAERSVKIVHFAKKSEPWLTIGIHPPGGDRRADILGKFETEREKRPRDGGTIAIPVAARKRRDTGIIRKRDRPGGFNFRQVGRAVRGDRGTFIIRQPDGSGGIFRRVKGVVSLLYLLVHRAPLQPDLHFADTAGKAVDDHWAYNFERALDEALRTAK